MYNISIKADLKSIEHFKNLKLRVRKNVIENGVDKKLAKDVAALKQRLSEIINKEIRSKEEQKTDILVKGQEISIPKSDEIIINHLTGLDLSKFRKTKDYNSLVESGIALGFDRQKHFYRKDSTEKTISPMSSEVTLRIPMSPMDTFESHFEQAVNYFNNAMFTFIDSAGKVNYYMNPGINLRNYVKIVCSRETGDTKASRKRFAGYQSKKDYADWSIEAKYLDTIKNSFINLTPIIEKIKNASFSDALSIMNSIGSSSKINNKQSTQISEKIQQLEQQKELKPEVETYSNIVLLIRNLKVEKRISDTSITYTLISSYGKEPEGSFLDAINKQISFWITFNKSKWLGAIVSAAIKTIKEFQR